jgi:hypothetical protein
MKIRPFGAELFHPKRKTDGQASRPTDMKKLTILFSLNPYLANVENKVSS